VSQACGAASTPSAPGFNPCIAVSKTAAVADFNADELPDLAIGTLVSGPQNAGFSSFDVLLNDSPGDGFLTAGVSSANLTWPVGPGSIASAFGINLAPSTEMASGDTLPTTLGGIRLHVRDRSHTDDMLAQLLYVSPAQINYVNPSSDSFAWIGIERVGSPYVPKGIAAPITGVAPGFYSVGPGLAAANAVSIAPDGTQTSVPVISCAGSACGPVPIDLSGPPVYLSLYGTGFAQASAALSNCTIAGQTLPVSYAGPQMQTPGLDQLNVLLPTSLIGSGETSITCRFEAAATTVAGTSNAVNLTIR
jgi:uncharacterized protein (TIGR03437 family)